MCDFDAKARQTFNRKEQRAIAHFIEMVEALSAEKQGENTCREAMKEL